jgi:hypothetical protein
MTLCSVFLFAPPAFAQSTSADKRLETIEKKIRDLELRQTGIYTRVVEGTGRVVTFLGTTTSFGGFIETALTDLEGDDMEHQVSANSTMLGLNISSKISDELFFSSQVLTGLVYTLQNPHNNPAVTPSERQFDGVFFGSLVAQGYVEYRRSTDFNLQAGMGYVPFGHAMAQREPVLFHRRGGPQMANSSDSNNVGIAFPLWIGLHMHGSTTLDDKACGYNLYTFTPSQNTGTLGGGLRFWWKLSDDLALGVSGQAGKQRDDNSYAHGFDVHWSDGHREVTAEYARNEVVNAPDVLSYYLEPSVKVADTDWLIYAVADFLDEPGHVSGAARVPDPFQRWAFGGGVNWVPQSRVRFRLGFLSYQYQGETAALGGQARDYQSFDFSVGAAF